MRTLDFERIGRAEGYELALLSPLELVVRSALRNINAAEAQLREIDTGHIRIDRFISAVTQLKRDIIELTEGNVDVEPLKTAYNEFARFYNRRAYLSAGNENILEL